MTSITKTPKKELDVSGKGTPRVVSRMQTRLRTPSKTPDDKKLERERRKAENESLKKKPASGRKLKTAKEKEPANELEDEKHVKWEDQENHSSKEESESGEDSEGAVVLDDEKVDDVQVDLPEPLAESKQSPVIEEPANKPIDMKEEEELERKSTGKIEKVVDQHIGEPIVKVSVEPVDDKEAEAKERERVIVERYNHQWALENQRRQRITEQEHLRRQRVSKKIDADFERGMAQEYSSRENKSHRASKGNTTLLPTSHSTIKAESVDSDDELVDLTDYKAKLNELRSELEKVSKQLKEKSDLVQSLEANKDKDTIEGGEHLAQVLIHLEAASTEDKKVYQAEVSKLQSHIAQLEDTLKKSGEHHDIAFIEKLASELEESNRNALEKAKLVDYAHETLDAEIKNMEQQKVQYEADKKRWQTENQEIALRLQQAQAELQRREVNFKKEVKEGVRTEIQRLKNERKKRQDTTQPPNAPNPFFSPFRGDPVSSTLGSQLNAGEVVPPPFTSNSTSHSSTSTSSSAPSEADGKRKRSEFESEDGDEVAVEQETLPATGEAGSSHDGIPSLIDESEIPGNSEGQHRGSGEDNEHAPSDENNVDGEGAHEVVERDDQQVDEDVDAQQEDGDVLDEEEEEARPRPSKIRRLVRHLVVSATAAAMAYGFVAYEQHNTLVL